MRKMMNSKGINLIELLIGISITAFLAVVAIEFDRNKRIGGINQERELAANGLMRQFIDLRKKRIACVQPGGDLTPVAPAVVPPAAGAPAPVGINLMSLAIPSRNKNGTNFTETLSNVCVPAPAGTPALPALPDCDNNPGANTPICPAGQIPFVQVALTGAINALDFFPPAPVGAGNLPIPGDGVGGVPLGAALCMSLNGPVANYRDVNFDLFTYVRMGNGSVRPIRQQANIPRPKITNAASISICP